MSEDELPSAQRRLIAYAKVFLADQDQFPTLHIAADRFDVSAQTIHLQYLELAKKGFIERNAVGKWRFKREPDSGFSPLS